MRKITDKDLPFMQRADQRNPKILSGMRDEIGMI
jgi:hypothetical protein